MSCGPTSMHGWRSYNAERTHSGKYCYGKTPLQTFIESATLADDKQLDRISPTKLITPQHSKCVCHIRSWLGQPPGSR